ncbi:hypothetical protein ACFZDB_21395 [Streptomyces luteogriseus]
MLRRIFRLNALVLDAHAVPRTNHAVRVGRLEPGGAPGPAIAR